MFMKSGSENQLRFEFRTLISTHYYRVIIKCKPAQRKIQAPAVWVKGI